MLKAIVIACVIAVVGYAACVGQERTRGYVIDRQEASVRY